MDIKKHISDSIADKYKDLCAKLGDAQFNVRQLNKRIQEIEEEIDELNSAYPLIVGYLELAEKKSKEESDEDKSGS